MEATDHKATHHPQAYSDNELDGSEEEKGVPVAER